MKVSETVSWAVVALEQLTGVHAKWLGAVKRWFLCIEVQQGHLGKQCPSLSEHCRAKACRLLLQTT